MGTVSENAAFWAQWDWSRRGEEWSDPWGGSEGQWYGTILPRIARFLPAASVLEIGAGYGRWTHYLRAYCDRLVAVDLSQDCIQACEERFRDDQKVTCHVNDGMTLPMVEDRSIDFAFSFDSLVHAEADVVASYLGELARVLAPDGVAFVHHSNAGRYRRYFRLTGRIGSHRFRSRLYRLGVLDRPGWRSLTMTAERFRDACVAAGLHCISQELLTWRTRHRLVDCLSTLTRPESVHARPTTVLENRGFMAEAAASRRRSPLYTPSTRLQ